MTARPPADGLDDALRADLARVIRDLRAPRPTLTTDARVEQVEATLLALGGLVLDIDDRLTALRRDLADIAAAITDMRERTDAAITASEAALAASVAAREAADALVEAVRRTTGGL
jgi:methyl-accepting chemotaxis protein